MAITLKVSVCMITYNHEKYIREAIEGVLMQECDFEVELIVANDCSIDTTDKVIQDILQIHPRASWIKYIKHKVNIGMMPNFFDAMQQCQGKYIALCEGDDYWTDSLKLQKQVAFLEGNEEYSLVCGGYETLIEESRETSLMLKSTEQLPDNLDSGFDITIERFLNQWLTKSLTLVFRKDFLDFKLLKKYKYLRDVHLNYSLLRVGKGYYMKIILGVYRVHAGGIFSEISEKDKYISYLNVYGELYRKNKSDKFLKQKYYELLKNASNNSFNIEKPFVFYFKMFLISKNIKDLKLLIKSIVVFKK